MGDHGGMPRRLLSSLTILATLAAAGCMSGPTAFRQSHALHNTALRARIDEELLLNLVRLRYRDSPLFLQVGSIVSQFENSRSLGVTGTLPDGAADTLGLAAGFGWSEQPTYTFTPMQDDEFVRRLLTPIDLDVVVLLQRSGWSIERVLRLTVQNLGGLDNAASASGPTPVQAPAFADFLQLTRALRRLQEQGRIELVYEDADSPVSPPIERAAVQGADIVKAAASGLRFVPVAGAASQLVLTKRIKKPALRVSPAAIGTEELQAVLRRLGLPADHVRYGLVAGDPTAGPGAIAGTGDVGVNTRSLLGALFYLSHGIDVPEAHAAAGLVTIARDADGKPFDWAQMTGDLFRVKTARTRPTGAAIAVPYRNHWFYVEDTDLDSKSTFALLLELFNMSAKAPSSSMPTLTLPVGR